MRTAIPLVTALMLMASPALAEAPEVVTDIPVVHSLVSQVMGDLGAPSLLLDQGADVHDFQLRPSQISAVQGADLIVWIGPELTPWLDRIVDEGTDNQSLELLHQTGTTIREFEADHDNETDHDTHTGHSHDLDGHDHAHHAPVSGEHDHDGLDPHAWLDPDNAALWIGLIADALVERDPGNAVAYRANASLALGRINTLADELEEQLATVKDQPIVVAHDAYGYFADHFGLTIAASLAEGDAADPGAARRSELRALLESGGAACIFPEAMGDPDMVTVLAEGTETRIGAPLDPEGRGLPPGPTLYDQIMGGMVMAITGCLAGN
ncbi:zinc ABC transporter substrate-binding protein [Defluviimonas aestuarii]|uniref:zinc ABC transporter substrate-binding protein n=1 Tax=Albidovulum aestuarii TaxID=1130726 RepID=UPI00249BCF50|nr:zinc ABC transporter substrate-binding protein [Defluviimonas aestuarii]MDI3336988.1 zinc ABC transporter substrate-binding protein [Defluviimonas aestuarii]